MNKALMASLIALCFVGVILLLVFKLAMMKAVLPFLFITAVIYLGYGFLITFTKGNDDE